MRPVSVALLTGGSDKPYALGLASALSARGIVVDFVGSDELDCSEARAIQNLRFLNLRGDQSENAPFLTKAERIVRYYARLARYVGGATVPILHILWNNKFEFFDRTVLTLYYRAIGKRVVLTAHNVNAASRNHEDTWINRLTLRVQYRLCDHIFVHTDAMKRDLVSAFGVRDDKVTVIPFGINDTIPKTGLTRADARRALGIGEHERALLFFGQIAPYKGLEYLVRAVAALAADEAPVRLIVAGKVKRGSERYWTAVEKSIDEGEIGDLVIRKIAFIPDDQVEIYFEATDAVVIPYVDIFQSGVPFLAFSFGVPVIATDVGSLRDDVTATTGILCKPRDAADLARAITEFYRTRRHDGSGETRARIRKFAEDRHSWATVSERTQSVYATLITGHGDLGHTASNAQQT